jgi:hypothetical protein
VSLAWTAGTDGIAHAAYPGHARTLCGLKTQDPRWAWPTVERCAACLVLEAGPHVVIAASIAAPTTYAPGSHRASATGADLPGRSRPRQAARFRTIEGRTWMSQLLAGPGVKSWRVDQKTWARILAELRVELRAEFERELAAREPASELATGRDLEWIESGEVKHLAEAAKR